MIHIVFAITYWFCIPSEPLIDWGMSSRQGDRKSMEDKHLALVPFRGVSTNALFAIFDGHAGVQTAEGAAQHLVSFIPDEAIISPEKLGLAIEQLDAFLLKEALKDSGSCALVAHINNNILNIAWLGDSRAILCRNKSVILATTDHKPNDANELKKIKERGGFVSHFNNDVFRLNAILATSRALGNKTLKEKNVLSATPDTISCNVLPNDILIMACDGLWDVYKNDKVCEIVHNVLNFSVSDLAKLYPQQPFLRKNNQPDLILQEDGSEHLLLAARVLRDEAYRGGSTDNISVQIIKFK